MWKDENLYSPKVARYWKNWTNQSLCALDKCLPRPWHREPNCLAKTTRVASSELLSNTVTFLLGNWFNLEQEYIAEMEI